MSYELWVRFSWFFFVFLKSLIFHNVGLGNLLVLEGSFTKKWYYDIATIPININKAETITLSFDRRLK